MKTTCALILALVTSVTLTSESLAGPFHMSLPVNGLKAQHGPQVERVFRERFGHNILQLSVKDGLLEFFAGGEGPRSLLHLSAIADALAELELKLETGSWLLKPQEIGFQVRSATGINEQDLKQLFESFEGAEVELIGSLLWKSHMIVVVHVHGEVDLSALREHLRNGSVAIDDQVWGHWQHGWKIGTEAGRHGHQMGARSK